MKSLASDGTERNIGKGMGRASGQVCGRWCTCSNLFAGCQGWTVPLWFEISIVRTHVSDALLVFGQTLRELLATARVVMDLLQPPWQGRGAIHNHYVNLLA